MITEDYVSFEVANLLKEKGFDEPTGFVYSENGELMKLSDFGVRYLLNSECDDYPHWQFPFEGVSSIVSAPTIQMAMKWLRRGHNLAISTSVTVDGWRSGVSRIKLNSDGFIVDIIDGIDGGNIPNRDTYVEACEAAIKYCLETFC